MAKGSNKPAFYAVKAGFNPGIYLTWAECEREVKGFPNAKFQKFPTMRDAEAFIGAGVVHSTQPTTATTSNIPAIAPPSTPAISAPSSSASDPNFDPEYQSWQVIYSDGACKGNGREGSVAGVGVWWGDGDPRNISERCPGDQTNNRAELIAVIRALEEAPYTSKPLFIRTDSKYTIQCTTTWLAKWHTNNFTTSTGTAVKNQAVIKYLAALLAARASRGFKVKLGYVAGHVGILGNERADGLANAGAFMPEQRERDWEALEKAVESKVGKEDVKGEDLVDADFSESDLLSEEELLEMARTQNFD